MVRHRRAAAAAPLVLPSRRRCAPAAPTAPHPPHPAGRRAATMSHSSGAVPTLQRLAVATLIRFRDALGDLGDAPLELLGDVLAACSPAQLAGIEDETQAGSGRCLTPWTWPMWHTHWAKQFGGSAPPPDPRTLPPLPAAAEVAAGEPGVPPADYRCVDCGGLCRVWTAGGASHSLAGPLRPPWPTTLPPSPLSIPAPPLLPSLPPPAAAGRCLSMHWRSGSSGARRAAPACARCASRRRQRARRGTLWSWTRCRSVGRGAAWSCRAPAKQGAAAAWVRKAAPRLACSRS